MSEPRFFVCEHCGNLVGMIHDSNVPMMCCGQKMTELVPVSYTHLDVYKRQVQAAPMARRPPAIPRPAGWRWTTPTAVT